MDRHRQPMESSSLSPPPRGGSERGRFRRRRQRRTRGAATAATSSFWTATALASALCLLGAIPPLPGAGGNLLPVADASSGGSIFGFASRASARNDDSPAPPSMRGWMPEWTVEIAGSRSLFGKKKARDGGDKETGYGYGTGTGGGSYGTGTGGGGYGTGTGEGGYGTGTGGGGYGTGTGGGGYGDSENPPLGDDGMTGGGGYGAGGGGGALGDDDATAAGTGNSNGGGYGGYGGYGTKPASSASSSSSTSPYGGYGSSTYKSGSSSSNKSSSYGSSSYGSSSYGKKSGSTYGGYGSSSSYGGYRSKSSHSLPFLSVTIPLLLALFLILTLSSLGMVYTAYAFESDPEGRWANCCRLTLTTLKCVWGVMYNVYHCRLSELPQVVCGTDDMEDDDYTEEELERMKLRPGIEKALHVEHRKAMKKFEMEMKGMGMKSNGGRKK